MHQKLSRIPEVTIGGALLICLVGCTDIDPKSDLFDSLLARHTESGHGTYDLYSLKDGDRPSQVGQSISQLIDDGFVLDVGNLRELSYIECGGYRIPLGEDEVILRRRGEMIQEENFQIWITIDEGCQITRVRGLSLKPVSL